MQVYLVYMDRNFSDINELLNMRHRHSPKRLYLQEISLWP